MKKPSDGTPDFNTKRRCTDIVGTIVLFGMWSAMTAIGIYAFLNGNYKVIVLPMDYDGNVCGTNFSGTDMKSYPKLVYINSYGGGVCVKECPHIENLTDVRTLLTYNGVYQGANATIPADYVEVANYSDSVNVRICNENTCPTSTNYSYTSNGVREGNGYAYYAVDTFEVHVRCLTNPNAVEAVKEQVDMPDGSVLNIELLDNAAEFYKYLYGDIYTTIEYIFLFGFCISLVSSFVYAQLLRIRCILSSVIWFSIFATLAILAGSGAYAHHTATKWGEEDPQMHKDSTILVTRIMSYILLGVGAIVFFLVIYLRREMQIAMACVGEAARAVGAMPGIVFFPIFQCIGLILFMAVWIFYAVHLASMGEVAAKELPLDSVVTVRHYTYDSFIGKCGWFLLFSFFWTVQYIAALGEIIVAMSISKWYFSRNKRRIGTVTFLASVCTSMYYHTGTAAIGSLLVAIVKILQVIIAKVQRTARELNNKVGEALLCCCQCLLWAYEKFIKFMNKNAYIQTAIFGTGFCTSAKAAFQLILRNASRVGSISYVSTVVLFVGKLFISFSTAGVAYVVIDTKFGDEIYSPGGPTALVLFISYAIGSLFLDLFDTGTSTILHCFIADEEMFGDDDCYADDQLREWFDDLEQSQVKVVSGNIT